jgi:beta-N-acetylhexosaminidase
MGFDLNLAPVVDLLTNPQNPGIGIRSLGADRDAAVPLARALIAGHAESNVACCLKHFPGKGAASIDAHLDLPVLDLSLEEFRDPHLVIFEDLLGSAVDLAVMTTHVIVRGLDPDLPATLSPRVVRGLLRNDFGFEGLVIADDLEMGAIEKHWSIDEAAVMAAVAGHDVLPICHSHERQIAAAHGLQGALDNGRLDPDEHRAAVARIDAVAARSHAANAALPKPDHDLAREIARRSVRVFGDQRGLLPVDGAVCLLAQSPHNIVLVEDTTPGHWADNVSECFAVRGFDVAAIIELDPTSSDLTPLDRAHAHERVILLSWDAHRFEGTRAVLDHACSTLADRLIVVHLRNPSDQVFVPDTVTALTAFGYQQCQLEAIATAISA